MKISHDVAVAAHLAFPTEHGSGFNLPAFSPSSTLRGAGAKSHTGRLLACLILALACLRASASIAVDARVSKDQNTASATVTAPQFSTASSDELLLAFISADSLGSPNTSVNSVTGGGLVWTRVIRTNAQEGTAEIWRAFAPSRLSAISVAAQLSQSVVSSITVMTFSGVNSTGTNGSGAIGAVGTGNSSQGAPSASVISTHNGSVVVGVGDDYDEAISRNPSAGQTVVHQDLSPTGDTYWVQQITAAIPVTGTEVTLGDSAPTTDRYNLSICEIVPAPSMEVQSSAASLSFGTVTDGTVVTKPWTLSSIRTLQ